MEKLLNTNEAAEILGISPWTLRLYVRDGKIKSTKIGKRSRFESSDIKEFIKINKT